MTVERARNSIVAWVEETGTRIDRSLEVVRDEFYDTSLRLPTYIYVTLGIRGHEIRMGLDTGSTRTLMAEETYNALNADYSIVREAPGTDFQAVNGSKF